jgi:YD repeat-containing protein
VDGTGTTTYGYDSLERLSSTTNGAGAITGDAYNLDNQLTTLTYPNTRTVTYGYDNSGNVTSVTDWLGHTTNYTYDDDSNIASEGLANGVTSASTYDNSDQLTTISDALTQHLNKPFAKFTYTRNSDGLITTDVSTGMPGTQNQSYTYDPLNRLATSGAGSYAYDASSNLTSQPSTAFQVYNSSGELCLAGSTSGSCSTVPTSDTGYSEVPQRK